MIDIKLKPPLALGKQTKYANKVFKLYKVEKRQQNKQNLYFSSP